MDARAVVQYEVLPQLDALGVDGVARLLGAFANIKDEADLVASSALEAYGQLAGGRKSSDLAEAAMEQGIAYYQTMEELRQGVTNLLAVGLFHLFEQHEARVRAAMKTDGRAPIDLRALVSWPPVHELRLLANAVKHADGRSAVELRHLRPDYFIHMVVRDAPMAKRQAKYPRRLQNPLGGTDLFVRRGDLEQYRDSLRALWEEVLPLL